MRYFIELSYHGKNYHGWQKQPNAPSVQETIEKGMSLLLREPVTITGAGRTDTGVHARQMFAHFNTEVKLNAEDLTYKLNSLLARDIAISRIFPVQDDAHARFDAVSRTYEYWIVQKKDPFMNDFAYNLHYPIDIDKMNRAAEALFEHSDFQCFSKSKTDVKTYLCKIEHARWEFVKGKLVFTITADRFLRNMVRAIVGTLLDVGLGKMPEENVKKIIESKNRSKAGVSVPAHGLYLTKITYPYIRDHEPTPPLTIKNNEHK
ncbi:tRNA pseudouridine(38-40) synthase TruA [Sinomicrobium weinanense]|uniref:tRNA pseudouridine synthase A n=1 Tax=Sinomicrobium weinanense TaxID=2842200 RepID=A0A926Q3H3_9FLAO|nr:tRNA pseudouridine(38-40) synthase TruA [Sinomicrobium weinanense]MBC9797602.1 tRNA pseudouridine(38-40) synthase TruA [Sinomicrobium weinanense]MBU3123424.1 tRNA pseudouridine(38-40) synthase TruA [Sinomicrobium weinanense]